VRRRAAGSTQIEFAALACAIFDNDVLSKPLTKLGCEKPSEEVGMAARSKWHDDGNGALGPFGTRPVSHKPRRQNQNSKDARQGGRHFRKLICGCAQKRHWQTVCPLYPRKQTCAVQ
jgi:hypothetical protein